MEYMDNFDNLKILPHVVILGAGASYATMSELDLPAPHVMDNFIEQAGITDLFENITLETKSRNLEDIYSELSEIPRLETIRKALA